MSQGSLLELVRCPLHPNAGSLVRIGKRRRVRSRKGSAEEGLQCPSCGRVYPIVDGIPDLVVHRDPDGAFLAAESQQWDEHASTYDERREQDPQYMAPVEAAVDSLRARRGQIILDAGCGTGLTIRTYYRPGMRVVGMDLSMESLRRLRQTLHPLPINLVRGDLTALPFSDQTFDRVLSANAIQHLPDAGLRQQSLRDLARVARPAARVVVTAHNLSVPKKRAGWSKEGPASSHSGSLQYIYRFERSEFRALLASALVVKRIRGAGLPLPYRFKLSPLSRWLERLLGRFEASADWGNMLIGVCHKASGGPHRGCERPRKAAGL